MEALQEKKLSKSREFWKFMAIVVFIILPLRMWVIEPFIVSGDSMYPTFQNHNYLVIDVLSYKLGEPKRYDVVVFKYPLDTSRYFIKRIIGLPGETITIHNKHITITNKDDLKGFEVMEPKLNVETVGETTTTLASDEYFVLGDNRPVSSDSRVWGSLKKSFIVGKPLIRLFPLGQIGLFPGALEN
jgi:signal peptidase I